MADKEELKDKAVTKDSVVLAQTDYKGNSQSDLVDVEIVKDGSFYKEGQKDRVHPTVAAILKEKGLIK